MELIGNRSKEDLSKVQKGLKKDISQGSVHSTPPHCIEDRMINAYSIT